MVSYFNDKQLKECMVIKLLIADDDDSEVEALRAAIERGKEFEIVGRVSTGKEANEFVKNNKVDAMFVQMNAGFMLPEVLEANEDIDLEKRVDQALLEFAVLPRSKGYRCLKSACIIVYKDSEILTGVTKNLYPKLAKMHGGSAASVERVMRSAIEKAVNNCDVEVMYEKAGYAIDKNKGKPTTTEFIAIIIKYLQQEVLV